MFDLYNKENCGLMSLLTSILRVSGKMKFKKFNPIFGKKLLRYFVKHEFKIWNKLLKLFRQAWRSSYNVFGII